MTAPEQWVWLARIRRPQGRKGEIFAELLTDFPDKFSERRRLWLIPDTSRQAAAPGLSHLETRETTSTHQPRPSTQNLGAPGLSHLETRETTSPHHQARPVQLTHHWLHKGGVVLHFAGVESITAAEALKNLVVAIPLAERTPLAEDEAYIGDLIGCTLFDVSGEVPAEIGVVEDVDRTAGPTPLLNIRGAKGEILVPFASLYLRRIDLAAKRIEMALPEGLVDLNAVKGS